MPFRRLIRSSSPKVRFVLAVVGGTAVLSAAVLSAAVLSAAAWGGLSARSEAPTASGGPGAKVGVAPAPSSEGCAVHGSEACAREPRPSGAPAALADLGRTGPQVLEFSSRSCAACTKMASVVAAVERACSVPQGTIVPIDMDDEQGEALASKHAVSMLPTFLSVDAEGREVERLVGTQPGARLAEVVAAVRGTACAPL